MDLTYTQLIVFALVAFLLNLIIFYQIIRSAVASSNKETNKELLDQLRLCNQLKILELKKKGHSNEEIQKQIDFVFAIKTTKETMPR